jgi:glycyl-tRNA synthetase
MEKQALDSILNLIARRGIVLPSYEIYGQLAGFYDYGPIGVRIKQRIIDIWRAHFIESMGNAEIDGSIVNPEQVFEASGHLKNFSDPIAVCKKCGHSHRADKMLEDFFTKKKDLKSLAELKNKKVPELAVMLKDNKVKCERCGEILETTEVFNLMFATKIGPKGGVQGYLRPETAQNIFIEFKSIFRLYNMKMPFGIGQVGRAYRNEISPRNMLIRMREFNQMELEYFFDPEEKGPLQINGVEVGTKWLDEKVNFLTVKMQDSASGKDFESITISDAIKEGIIPNMLFAYLIHRHKEFMLKLGLDESTFRFRQVVKAELAHYSGGTFDLELKIGDKFEEVAGDAYRTDYDLASHQRVSKEDMSVLVGERKFVPHVVELSIGLDRLFLGLLYNALWLDKERGWEVLMLNKEISPYDYAIFPLQKDDKIVEMALQIREKLSSAGYSVFYSVAGSIGKRYAKADEIGIGKAITVDFESLENKSFTIRGIKDAKQERTTLEKIL